MDDWIQERLDDQECDVLFDRLFPHGLAGEDVMAELAPSGWEDSPFLPIFHPGVDRCFEETISLLQNLQSLFPRKEDPPPLPTFDEVKAEHKETPIEPARECAELVGRCLWHIFSDNHEVIHSDGRCVDIGSFRGAAGFIADRLNRQPGPSASHYDYMDFYMGLSMLAGRADVTGVYRMIFRRLKTHGCTWIYHFPRISLVYFGDLQDQMEAESPEAMLNYDPSEAFARQQERQQKKEQAQRMQAEFDEDRSKAIEEARKRPPPDTVQAYMDVYGAYPTGWPPE